MGCASSKQKRCRHCNNPYSPVTRSYSMHVHHPPQPDRDSYHVVALTSTSLNTLKLNNTHSSSNHHHHQQPPPNESFRFSNGSSFIQKNKEKEKEKSEKKDDFSMGLIEAKAWSNMIDQKLPKIVPMTPTMTPPGEPETINTWELMEGLEDTSPFKSPNRMRSFSFDVSVRSDNNEDELFDEFPHPPKLSFRVNTENNVTTGSPIRPLWLQMTEEEDDDAKLNPAIISDFDPEVLSSFRKTMQNLSPGNPFHLNQPPNEKGFSISSEEKNKTTTFDVFVDDGVKQLASCGKKEKVVLYFTSLRGVRKTYEDCCQVRLILKGCGVRVDERDVSMHSGFKEELRDLLLGENFGGVIRLPRVFVGKNYIGGAEEIQKLHEDGKLEKLLECCEKVENSDGGLGECEVCGDIRFVPCETCYGSCKIFYECDEEEEEDDGGGGGGEVDDYGFQRCPDCNENGLIRCPVCCY